MGRKVRKAKRRKVKDLAQIIEQRENVLKSKLNSPPRNPSMQDFPRGVKELIKMKALVSGDNARSKEKGNKRMKGVKSLSSSNDKDKDNSSNNKVSRKSSAKDSIISERGRSKENKTIQSVGKYVHKSGALLHSKMKAKNCKKKEKLRTKRKRKLIEARKERDNDSATEKIEMARDEIKFGEVIHKPPEITIRPRKVAVTGYEHRPGRKDDLLLKSVVSAHKDGLHSVADQKNKVPLGALSVKRKKLAISDRRQLEAEQQKAMIGYRQLVKRKRQNNR